MKACSGFRIICLRTLSAILFLAMSMTFAFASPPANEITEENALAVAAQLASAVDIPFGEGAACERKEGGFLAPEFQVKFHGFSTIRVDSETGDPIGFMDHSAFLETYAAAEAEPMPEESAIAIAEGVIRELGSPEGLVFASATLKAPIDEIPAWICKWNRLWNGIPYYRGGPEGAHVWVAATTGGVVSAAIYRPPPAPAVSEIALQADSALETALSFARSEGLPLTTPLADPQLSIVQPNYAWPEGSAVQVSYDTPSRIAWVINIGQIADDGLPHLTGEFWVDAATGEILGGARSGGLVHSSSAQQRPAAGSPTGGNLLLPATLTAIVTVAVIAGAFHFLRLKASGQPRRAGR